MRSCRGCVASQSRLLAFDKSCMPSLNTAVVTLQRKRIAEASHLHVLVPHQQALEVGGPQGDGDGRDAVLCRGRWGGVRREWVVGGLQGWFVGAKGA